MGKKRRKPAAAPVARRAVMVDRLSRPLAIARSLWHDGRHADALDVYRDVLRQEPDNVRAYVMTARAYAEKFDFERMEEVHDRLVRRAPKHPGVHHYLGETYARLKLPAKAIASYEHAAGLPGAAAPTWLELASLYEGAHRLEEAEELIERAVCAGYNLPLVGLIRGRIQRRLENLEQAESSFRELIKRFPDRDEACQAWSEIALMKDRQGDYAGAVGAIAECKKVQQTHEAPFVKAAEKGAARVRRLAEDLTRGHLQRWRDQIDDLPPQRVAVLTGFPRSGTTLLEQIIDAHPDLISSEERAVIGQEVVRSFCAKQGRKPLVEVLDDLRLEQIQTERERYFRAMEHLLGEPVQGRMHVDKNPAYNPTLPILLRLFPEARLLVAVRDPRDVVLSCYLRHLPLNTVSVCFLTPERTAQRYAADMTIWLRLRELLLTEWLEVRYEDTVADLAAQARRTLATLGLEWTDEVLSYRSRLGGEKHVSSPTYEAVAQPIYQGAIGRWRNYEELLKPTFETLAPFLREFGYG